MNTKHLLITALLSLAAFVPLLANAGVADRHLFDRVEVAGITLNTPAREAFESLIARGYSIGNLKTYDDWEHSGLNAVKGDRNAPEGHSEIVLTRNGAQLVEIREHLIRLRNPFDVVTETEAKRKHFGLPADDKDCKISANGKAANCGAENSDGTAIYLLTFNGDRQRYAVVQRLDLKPSVD